MELVDVVDENGCPTGEVVERTEAHDFGIRHRTAHVWILKSMDRDPYVLLQKRADTKDSFPGRFDTSSAGHIHAGDEPISSALRELEEELGIHEKQENLNYAGSFRIRYEKVFHGRMFRDNEISFVYVLFKDIAPEILLLQKEEVSEARWFLLSEVLLRVAEKDDAFCVPPAGLDLLKQYVERHTQGA